jgi:8-oxo-dGTP pyrophosphatase MutT (NUDIX family)
VKEGGVQLQSGAVDIGGFNSIMCRRGILAALFAVLPACSDQAPTCPFAGIPDDAPSAGCFAASPQGLLMVQGLNGKISLPGGSSEPGESAQCTAFRETWEETGLRLQPGRLLRVFSTGFHLYRCERDASSGEIDPPPRFEVRAAFYLPAHRFGNYEWRFEDERALLQAMLLDVAPGHQE